MLGGGTKTAVSPKRHSRPAIKKPCSTNRVALSGEDCQRPTAAIGGKSIIEARRKCLTNIRQSPKFSNKKRCRPFTNRKIFSRRTPLLYRSKRGGSGYYLECLNRHINPNCREIRVVMPIQSVAPAIASTPYHAPATVGSFLTRTLRGALQPQNSALQLAGVCSPCTDQSAGR